MTDCVFCEIVAGDRPADIYGEWSEAIAFTPLEPVAPGHLLVVSRAHVPDFRSSPQATGEVAARAARIANLSGVDMNMITSAGSHATQTIRHLHIHLVPRHSHDGLALPWTSGELTQACTNWFDSSYRARPEQAREALERIAELVGWEPPHVH